MVLTLLPTGMRPPVAYVAYIQFCPCADTLRSCVAGSMAEVASSSNSRAGCLTDRSTMGLRLIMVDHHFPMMFLKSAILASSPFPIFPIFGRAQHAGPQNHSRKA